MRSFSMILWVESKIVLRHRDSIVFGIGLPLLVAVLIGLIYGTKPAYEGADFTFIQQSFGALISIGICATGLMGVPLHAADYRHKRIFKRFRVTPISPASILLLQIIPQMAIAVISTFVVYGVVVVFFGYKMTGSIGGLILAYILVMASIYSIGMMVASISPNMKIANVLCTLIYFPMLFLSGATVPYEVMPTAVQKMMDVLPLTQGIKLLKGYSLGTTSDDLMFTMLLLIGIAVVCTAIAIKCFRWE